MYVFLKRVFDIVFSGLLLVILLPVWLVAVIGIEVSDFGPVFYMAKRVGKGDKVFKMFKFRSMRVDKAADERSLRPDVNRIFPWGSVMRRTKIDELPQLINIFIGDMSFVGPRPASVDQIEITRTEPVLSTALPGLTGPSALYDFIYGDDFEDEAEYEEKVLPTRLKLDVYYMKVRSAKYDFKMIWYTAVCVFDVIFGRKPEKILEELRGSVK